jgi:hypothetical protein
MVQELLKHQWVIMALFGGAASALYIILYYVDFWRPRKVKDDDPETYDENYMSANRAIPWSIKMIILVLVAFMFFYTLVMIYNPKNW